MTDLHHDLHHTAQSISLEPPDGGGEYYEVRVEIWWKLKSKAVPAIMYSPNAGPTEGAVWEIDSIKVEE